MAILGPIYLENQLCYLAPVGIVIPVLNISLSSVTFRFASHSLLHHGHILLRIHFHSGS